MEAVETHGNTKMLAAKVAPGTPITVYIAEEKHFRLEGSTLTTSSTTVKPTHAPDGFGSGAHDDLSLSCHT
jgi:hypothetical protein